MKRVGSGIGGCARDHINYPTNYSINYDPGPSRPVPKGGNGETTLPG